MTWHYQIRKRLDTGSVYYDMVEVYEEDGESDSWTESSIAPIADTPEEMITVLEMMLKDARAYPVFDEAKHEQ